MRKHPFATGVGIGVGLTTYWLVPTGVAVARNPRARQFLGISLQFRWRRTR